MRARGGVCERMRVFGEACGDKNHIRFIARCSTAQAFIFLTTPYPYFLRFHRGRGLTHPTIREIAGRSEERAVEKFDFFFMSDRIDERALL